MVVLDVGANIGQWGNLIRQSGFKGRIISFEPVPAAFKHLELVTNQDLEWMALNVGIGEQYRQRASFNVASNSGQSSSFFTMGQAHQQIDPTVTLDETIEIDVIPLDSPAVRKLVRTMDIYLKADVQGSERKVLEGLGDLWPQVQWIELEMWLKEAYLEAPTFWSISEMLRDNNFSLFAIDPGGVSKSSGQQISVDCIWKRGT
jgi:FkbM family methyltransferase